MTIGNEMSMSFKKKAPAGDEVQGQAGASVNFRG